MTDRELLELAAKAAGIDWWRVSEGWEIWNPIDDDGDALRLAIPLGFTVASGSVLGKDGELFIDNNTDFQSATRRAIVRAAAEIGKAMNEAKGTV